MLACIVCPPVLLLPTSHCLSLIATLPISCHHTQLLTRARPSGDADPLLDPRMNPNIRIDSDASA